MIKRKLWLAAFFPLLGPVPSGADEAAELANLSIERLCESRADPAALAEIERREVFSRRELRAIRDERLRPGIRQEAMFCFMGLPDGFVPVATLKDRDPMDAYFYPERDGSTLVVQIRQRDDTATVVRWYSSTDPLAEGESWSETLCSLRPRRPGCTDWSSMGWPHDYQPRQPVYEPDFEPF